MENDKRQMPRKEAINTFTDGLNTDLSPLNTPNTILTDCLNGTLITYDGNEFTLQNDKGNYPLRNCKLDENYVPVGVKEYGDIIYIISYNPLTNKTQIGSYPSPKTILSPTDYKYDQNYPENNTPLHYSTASLWDGWSGEKNYSSISNPLYVFYGGSNPDDYKINPGDQYKIYESKDLGPYEGLKYYIIDEERKLYDISNDVETTTSSQSTTYHFVSWNIPGFLAAKSYIADIDDFRINVRKAKVPTFNTSNDCLETLVLNIQIFTSDVLFNDLTISSLANSPFKLKFEINNNIINPTIQCGKRNLNNGQYCYYFNCTFNNITTDTGIVEVKIIPSLSNGDGNNTKSIIYDKFIKTLTFNLNSKGDAQLFDIGDTTFKYNVDDEKISIMFDTSGIDESSVWNEDVYLLYSIEGYGAEPRAAILDANGAAITRKVYTNWNVSGISDDLEIPFVPYPISGAPPVNRFYAEDFYKIKFEFSNTDAPIGSNGILKTITKTILASKLLNDINSNNYEEIYFDQWVEEYKKYIESPKLDISGVVDNSTISSDTDPTFSYGYNVWRSGCQLKNYPKLINYVDYIDSSMKDGFTVSAGINFNVDLSYSNNIKIPRGPLWESLSSRLKVSTLPSAYNFNPTSGTCTFPVNTESTISAKALKSHKYRFVQRTDNEKVYSYTSRNLRIPEIPSYDMTVDGLYEKELGDNNFAPDIEITPPQGNPIRFTKNQGNSESNNNEAVNKVIRFIGKDEKYPFDVLFLTIKMPIQQRGDKNPNNNYLKLCGKGLVTGTGYKEPGTTWNSQTVPGEIFASATYDTAAQDTYYIVFRVPGVSSDKLWFVPIKVSDVGVAYSKFSTYVNNVKFFEGNDDAITGAYYMAERSPKEDIDSSVAVNTITSSIQRTAWIYKGQNMLSEQGRQNHGQYTTSKFFTTRGTYSSLQDIELEPYDFNLEYTGDLSGLDSIISSGDNIVDLYNSDISTELSSYSADTLLKAFTPDYSGYYYDNAYTPNAELLRLLNRERSTGDMFVFSIKDSWNPDGDGSIWGHEYDQYLIMGVVDLSLYLV